MAKTVFLLLATAIILSGCAHQPTTDAYNAPGFLAGLWHGLVAPLALIGHLFDPNIRIYEFPNSGGWYDFGFLLGLGGLGSGAAAR